MADLALHVFRNRRFYGPIASAAYSLYKNRTALKYTYRAGRWLHNRGLLQDQTVYIPEQASMPPWIPRRYYERYADAPGGGQFPIVSMSRRSGTSRRGRLNKKMGFINGHPARYTRRGIKQELKYFDQQLGIQTLLAADLTDRAFIQPLFAGSSFGVAQGSGPEQRIGRKIFLRKLQLRFVFSNTAESSAGIQVARCDKIRILIVEDTQCNGVVMAAAQLLEHVSSQEAAFNSFLNMATVGRFKVYKDKVINLRDPPHEFDGTAAADFSLVHTQFKFTKKWKFPLSIEYNNAVGNSGTLDEVTRSNVYMVIVPIVAGTAGWDQSNLIFGEIRIRYDG